jgi:hypothetical protein
MVFFISFCYINIYLIDVVNANSLVYNFFSWRFSTNHFKIYSKTICTMFKSPRSAAGGVADYINAEKCWSLLKTW